MAEVASMSLPNPPLILILPKQQTLSSMQEITSSEADIASDAESAVSQLDTPSTEEKEDSDTLRNDTHRAVLDRHIKHQQEKERQKDVDADTVDKEQQEYSTTIEAESARIIDKVRDYQQELFERAKSENIIAVLDTGSGKTLIACLLIKHILDQELLDRAEGRRQRIVFFLANSVHLVQQQARVLANNLIDKPAVLYGNSKNDLWKKSNWNSIREHNKLVVCTPAILDQCLMHAFLNMQDISLLVFDEAHHAKKDHPYSRLIRSYYLKCPHEHRPRIFGMTASAVDSKGDIAITAKNLEEILQAKIVTTDDGSLLSFAPKPTNVKWLYPRLRTFCTQTDLYSNLFMKIQFCEALKQGFVFASKATVELGPWCADRVWKYVIGCSAHESSRISSKFEKSQAYADLPDGERTQAMAALDEAFLLVRNYVHPLPQLTSEHLSSKVIRLCEELAQHFQNNPNTRAIVFVEERLKALVLHDCLSQLCIPHIRSGILLGIAGTNFEAISMKHQEQMLQRFRAGLINLVFATSVADEGLDIPQCNLCVRFDLCKTTIQYMQSKGRARMKGSIFAHMVEDGDLKQSGEVDYQLDNEMYIKKWCSSLEPDRRLGQGTELTKLLSKDSAGQAMRTASGAMLDYSNALLILARFTASLRHTGALTSEIYEEEIDIHDTLFRYVVRLPANSECQVRGCRGDWKPNKQLAKRSAAFGCCYLLRNKGYLNDNLDSIFRKLKPENLNARLAVTVKKEAYDMQVKPTAWQSHLDVFPTELYATIWSFCPERKLKHQVAPIVMLTKAPLPAMPSFCAYLEDNVKTDVMLNCVPKVLQASQEQVNQLTTFTLRAVFSDVFNKVYAFEPEKMSYWLAPLAHNMSSDCRNIEDVADMPALKTAQGERQKWESGVSSKVWTNKFICDPLNGRFHYFTGDVAPEVKITDPVPDSVPHIAQKKRHNIIDFSNSLWTATKKRATEEHVYDYTQPVLHADLIGTRRNFLDQAASAKDIIPCLIAPETLQIARMSVEFAASCLLWPALIHRIEAYMIAIEAFTKLDLPGVSADLALEAFTKDADNDNQEQQVHTSGKRGMGKNYERLEFIGDSLLKMTTTMTVFNRTVCDEEGMHCRRMEILCNRNLFNVATAEDLQLYKYARTLAFDRTTWYPENLKLLQGRGARKDPIRMVHEPVSQDLGMKTIADMSEAIIGAVITATAHLSSQNNRFDLGIKAVTKLVRSADHDVNSWSDIAAQYSAPAWSLQTNDPIANDRAQAVAAKTGYQFRYPRLLRSALTHSSDMNSTVPDLQRLEFLGDAILDWVCISWLFNTNPTRNPQWLTEHKMAMVSNKFLAALAVTLDFDKFVFVTTAKLIADIQTYAIKVREGLARPDCPKSFWTEIESPPKALSDLVESYLGAVLVDSGFDYSEIENFFNKHVKHFFEDISEYDTFANRHPTTYLYNKLSHEYKCRDYGINDSGDPVNEGGIEVEIVAGVIVHGSVIAESRGTSARYARVRASKNALAKLDGLSRDEFRRKFGCNCALRDK
ncbi:Dicer-like protein 1 [Lithohypha guttulata]|nr:Dicer-like protein 1 [Lithohypha guttulata]